jgi:DNA-directed RNA polymerase subunit M/transcription elongation factor TFIIS
MTFQAWPFFTTNMWQGDNWPNNDTLDDVIDNVCRFSSSSEAVALLWAVRKLVVREGFFIGSYGELFLRVLLEWDPVTSLDTKRNTDAHIGDGSEQLQAALYRFVTDVTRRTDSILSTPTAYHQSAHLFGLLVSVVSCNSPSEVLEKCSERDRPSAHLFCVPWPYITLCSPIFSALDDSVDVDDQDQDQDEDEDVWQSTQRVLSAIDKRWKHDCHLDALRNLPRGDPLVHTLTHLSAHRGPDPDRICIFCVEEGMACAARLGAFVYSEQSELEPLASAFDEWRGGVERRRHDAEVDKSGGNGPRCPRCKVGLLRVSLVQVRGGDEPMSERHDCTKCDLQRYKN